jgi:hypothetical protein
MSEHFFEFKKMFNISHISLMIFDGFFSLYPYQKAVHGYLALHPGNPICGLPVMPVTSGELIAPT